MPYIYQDVDRVRVAADIIQDIADALRIGRYDLAHRMTLELELESKELRYQLERNARDE